MFAGVVLSAPPNSRLSYRLLCVWRARRPFPDLALSVLVLCALVGRVVCRKGFRGRYMGGNAGTWETRQSQGTYSTPSVWCFPPPRTPLYYHACARVLRTASASPAMPPTNTCCNFMPQDGEYSPPPPPAPSFISYTHTLTLDILSHTLIHLIFYLIHSYT